MADDDHVRISFGRRVAAARLSRRRFLELTGAATMLAPLAACDTGSKSSSDKRSGDGAQIAGEVPGPGPVSGGRRGGRIVAGYSTSPDNNDPALGADLFSYDIITELVFFGGLLAYGGQTSGPVANLADMPSISRDTTTFTFKLRDAKFHTGRRITADDVKWSWERVLLPKTGAWGTSYFHSVVGAQDMIRGKAKRLEGVEVVDGRTLKVTLEQPDFTFLNTCCQPFSAPVPREEVARLGPKFSKTPVGFGPFKFDSYDEGAQVARLVRFDDYFYSGLPYLDEIEMHWGTDPQTLLQQIKGGNIHLIGDAIPGNLLGAAVTDPSIEPLIQSAPVLSSTKYFLNTKKAPFDNVKLRQALNWAINRDDIAKVLHGGVAPDGKPFPRGIGEYTSTFAGYGYDPTKAKQLLAAAGYSSGGPAIKITADAKAPGPTVAQIVQQNLNAVGIDASIDLMQFATYSQLSEQGKLAAWPDGWFMIQPTPADIVDNQYVSGASANKSGFSNREVDRLATIARQNFDVESRNELYAQAEQIIGEEAPAIYLYSGTYKTAVAERLRNWHYRSELGNYYDRLWLA